MSEMIFSPVQGTVVNLDKVNDEVFSKRMLGDGVAVIPSAKEVVSPVDATVTMVYETQHAIGLETEAGNEILLHIGIDTVMLNGVPFNTKVKVGDKVHKGDVLTEVDWNHIEKNGCDTVIPVLAINKKIKLIKDSGETDSGEALFEIE